MYVPFEERVRSCPNIYTGGGDTELSHAEDGTSPLHVSAVSTYLFLCRYQVCFDTSSPQWSQCRQPWNNALFMVSYEVASRLNTRECCRLAIHICLSIPYHCRLKARLMCPFYGITHIPLDYWLERPIYNQFNNNYTKAKLTCILI